MSRREETQGSASQGADGVEDRVSETAPRQASCETPERATEDAAPEPPRPPLSEAAKRALAEAEARRAAEAARQAARPAAQNPKELGGRPGPEPTRYGDWEKKGLISDF